MIRLFRTFATFMEDHNYMDVNEYSSIKKKEMKHLMSTMILLYVRPKTRKLTQQNSTYIYIYIYLYIYIYIYNLLAPIVYIQ